MKNIYVCGPTVYSEPHIGNMRPIMVFDIFIRANKCLGEEINFIHNITDIDDKIIARAEQENTTEKAIASKYEAKYLELLKTLNIQIPNHMPKVLDNIDLIIDFIETLVENKKAYVHDGNVYFDVTSTPGYGLLSNRNLDELRYEEDANKKHPADFALWKNTTSGIKFDSPWGQGRPGWHTECVVFISKYLGGKPLDIHGGGIDLLFPHHENENIQHKAAFGNEITKEWKHVGHLNYEGVKMSKSLGNLISTSDFISLYGVDTLRYIFLTTSYSSPIDLTHEIIRSSKEQVGKFLKLFKKSQLFFSTLGVPSKSIHSFVHEINAWNFANAMKIANEILKNFNKIQNEQNAIDVFMLMQVIGFSFSNDRISDNVKNIYSEWESARNNSNFDLADKLRNELKDSGII